MDPAPDRRGARPARRGGSAPARGDRGRAPARASRADRRGRRGRGRHGIPVIEDASEALGARLHRGPVRRPRTSARSAGSALQLQRQQAHHDRRRRDDRHRRRGARPTRAPPLDPGPPARACLRPRRGRLQLPALERGRGLGARAARAELPALLAGAARDRRRLRRGDRRRCRLRARPARAMGRSVLLAVHRGAGTGTAIRPRVRATDVLAALAARHRGAARSGHPLHRTRL